MAELYSVSNWDNIFENNRSREIKELNWIAIPNRHDGSKFAELMAHKNGPQHFAAWILIVQVASRVRDSRGILRRGDGTPHTPLSLSLVTRCPEPVFSEAIPRLLSLGWLNSDENQQLPQVGAGLPQVSAVEGEGREQNRRGERRVFVVPHFEEVKEYCQQRGNKIDPEAFIAFYTSKGWKVGNSPMKDWKSAIITWEKREKKNSPFNKPKGALT